MNRLRKIAQSIATGAGRAASQAGAFFRRAGRTATRQVNKFRKGT